MTIPHQKAFLVSVYQGTEQKRICIEHLQELAFLAKTYGVEVVGSLPCSVRKFDAARYLGSGKLEEILALKNETGANLIIFDDEITPTQQKNLTGFFGVEVLDRTAVILGVFEQRAQTKEARLQVEWAKVKYQAPRLKRMWTHLSRQAATGGGGAYLKGEGEKQIEIDRRILKQKLHQLDREIEEVRHIRKTQRQARVRQGIPTFALIGYTNVGKSTLLNALTKAGVFVEDKLFATLDPATRKFTLPNNQEILLIDTVGFIRKIPHLLVAAFRSTLEEAFEADILLHVLDVSHPMAEEQAMTTFEVLKELKVKEKPMIHILNKADQCENPASIQRIRLLFPKTVVLSAKTGEGLDDLINHIIEELKKRRQIVKLRIPQSHYTLVNEIHEKGKILTQEYLENDIVLVAEIPSLLAIKLKPYHYGEP